jgi:hypothetical protein
LENHKCDVTTEHTLNQIVSKQENSSHQIHDREHNVTAKLLRAAPRRIVLGPWASPMLLGQHATPNNEELCTPQENLDHHLAAHLSDLV